MARFARWEPGNGPIEPGHIVDGWVTILGDRWPMHGEPYVELRALPDETAAEVVARYNRVLGRSPVKILMTPIGFERLDQLLQEDLDAQLSQKMLDTPAPPVSFTHKGEPT
jgi:hypothetical protein